MAWTFNQRFPSWGDTGVQPNDGYDYQGRDFVDAAHLDYLWNNVENFENEVGQALLDIDSDQDGIVDEADSANTYKNNDIDSDGDGKVDNADQLDGNEPSELPSNVDVEHDGSNIDTNVSTLNFGANLNATGTGNVTVEAVTASNVISPDASNITKHTRDETAGGTYTVASYPTDTAGVLLGGYIESDGSFNKEIVNIYTDTNDDGTIDTSNDNEHIIKYGDEEYTTSTSTPNLDIPYPKADGVGVVRAWIQPYQFTNGMEINLKLDSDDGQCKVIALVKTL